MEFRIEPRFLCLHFYFSFQLPLENYKQLSLKHEVRSVQKNFKFKRTSRQNRAHVLNEKELIVINRLKPCGSTDIRSVGDPCNSCRQWRS